MAGRRPLSAIISSLMRVPGAHPVAVRVPFVQPRRDTRLDRRGLRAGAASNVTKLRRCLRIGQPTPAKPPRRVLRYGGGFGSGWGKPRRWGFPPGEGAGQGGWGCPAWPGEALR